METGSDGSACISRALPRRERRSRDRRTPLVERSQEKGRSQDGAAFKSREETPKGHPGSNLCCNAAKVKPPLYTLHRKYSTPCRLPPFPLGSQCPEKEKAAAGEAQPSFGREETKRTW
ncbi:hypothetical protein [Azospirillum argentinense]